MFNTVRVPGIETDKIVHYEDIDHIVVLHKGCYYKMIISHNDRFLNPCELKLQLDQIVQRSAVTTFSEKHLASLTAWNRTKWAQAREKYFSTGANQVSLHTIESAAFVLVLDEEPFKYDLQSTPSEYGYYGQQLLHGKGYDRWFDKSFNCCVGSNGKVRSFDFFKSKQDKKIVNSCFQSGLNGEHTWGDAPVLSQMFEDCLFDEREG